MQDKELVCEALSALLGKCIKHGINPNMSLLDFHHRFFLAHHYSDVEEEFFIDVEEFFDHRFDYDYTNMTTSPGCMRGDEPYQRPFGWYRMAVKVLDKYPDRNWLGPNGWRSESAPGEWPVSFHGTSKDGARGIISCHYEAGKRQLYGRGIYSTPVLRIATDYYSTIFKSKKNGKSYKVVMQNRINPKEREKCKRDEFWLVRVPENTSKEEEKRIVERSIRPYGILIQEVE
ncbi:uncharacterized protein [Salvelinus alpinus]|uniref:uncharacterized protein n=1 Tax=Salvelinus alpinus TaxID=8036 RepID=UPI0039FDC177